MSGAASSTPWAPLLRDHREAFESALADHVARAPWYRTPASKIARATVTALHPLPNDERVRIALVEVAVESGARSLYALPLALVSAAPPDAALFELADRFVVDALTHAATQSALVTAMLRGDAVTTDAGMTLRIHGVRETPLAAATSARRLEPPSTSFPLPYSARASTVHDTTVVEGERWIAKVIHKSEPGESPELEMTRFLAAAGYRHIPKLAGYIDLQRDVDGETVTSAVAVLSAFVPNRGDALSHLASELQRWLDEIAPLGEIAPPKLPPNDLLTRALFPLPEDIVLAVGDYIRPAALLGTRVGEMHKVLSRTHIEAFAPEPLDAAMRERIADSIRADLAGAIDRLSALRDDFPPATQALFDLARTKQTSIERRLVNVVRAPEGGVQMRIHGDLHLGQILFTGTDFVVFDFQGDPTRPVAERKAKQSPLVDVAGILRSFHYAAIEGLRARPEDTQARLAPWVALWHRAVAASFLGGWLRAVAESSVLPSAPAITRALLDLFVLERCVRELQHALRYRPDWVDVPLDGIRDLLETERKPGQMRTSRRFTPFIASTESVHVEPSPLDPDAPAVRAFKDGTATHAHRLLGVHLRPDGLADVAVWAPTATQVAIAGDFNDHSSEAGLLAPVGDSGLFAGVIRKARIGQRYVFRVVGLDVPDAKEKADPFARSSSPDAEQASMIAAFNHPWGDAAWMGARRARAGREAPFSLCSVDLAQSRRGFRDLAVPLAERARTLGFTHVELGSVLEHRRGAADAPSSFFAPASRLGSASDLMFLVDTLHQAGLGVVFVWTPSSFAPGAQGLTAFDGGPTFEASDPVRAVHPASGAGLFDLARAEVRSFLLSSATFWIEQFHADGLRIDGLATVLYRDFGRLPGTWSPNAEGGRESLEGAAFIRQLTSTLAKNHPDVELIADGTSAWRGVTSVGDRGLGFGLASDTQPADDLQFYLSLSPAERAREAEILERALTASRESTLLVVDPRLRSPAQARLLHALAWSLPGKKMVYADVDSTGDAGLDRMLADLNEVYRLTPVLQTGGITLGEGALVRARGDDVIALAFNVGDKARDLRIEVPRAGLYRPIFDSGASKYGGDSAPPSPIQANPEGSGAILPVRVPPLTAILLARQ